MPSWAVIISVAADVTVYFFGVDQPLEHMEQVYKDRGVRLEADFRLESRDGRAAVAYYIQNGIVRGVLLWNTWGQLSRAREVMSESAIRMFKDDELGVLITPGG